MYLELTLMRGQDETMGSEPAERVSSPQTKGKARRKLSTKGAKTLKAVPKKRGRPKRKASARSRKVACTASEDSLDEEE